MLHKKVNDLQQFGILDDVKIQGLAIYVNRKLSEESEIFVCKLRNRKIVV